MSNFFSKLITLRSRWRAKIDTLKSFSSIYVKIKSDKKKEVETTSSQSFFHENHFS